jgi:integrase
MLLTRNRRKPLSPRSVAAYSAVLLRAYGTEKPKGPPKKDLKAWSTSTLKILHAAILRTCPERIEDLPEPRYEVRRVIQAPTEVQLVAFEKYVDKMRIAVGTRALMLLPLMLGLRAAETLSLQRAHVESAAAGELLLILRKGGREQLIPAAGVKPLLQDMLTTEWEISWQLISATSDRAAYRTLHRMIQLAGQKAQIQGLRPHKLRHGFASRMHRAGADLAQIQKMMGHADPAMTSRYVHVENKDIVKFLQVMTRGK